MKSESKFDTLLSHIGTVEERDMVLGLLGSVTGIPTNTELKKALGGARDDIYRLVSDFFSRTTSEKARMDFIDALEALPVIRLTLAIVPSEKALVRWHKLCIEKLQSPCVLDVTKDPQIAAGAIIEIRGRMFRYALQDVIEKG